MPQTYLIRFQNQSDAALFQEEKKPEERLNHRLHRIPQIEEGFWGGPRRARSRHRQVTKVCLRLLLKSVKSVPSVVQFSG